MREENRIIQATEIEDDTEEVVVEQSLRPQSLEDYIGQEQIKQNLHIFLEAAKQRNEALDHVLLYGLPGLGKTSLAHIIAKEMGVNIRITSGPAIEKTGDLAAILTNLQPHDILFIDEIHRLHRTVEEVLYPAMEDYALDIIIGKGPSAKTVRLDLPKFTLIGATTKVSLLSSPLRDRFGSIHKLQFYSDPELQKIIKRSANILGIKIDDESALKIAQRCRKTPRIANRLLRRVRDFAQVKGDGHISPQIADNSLKLLAVDNLGLDQADRNFLLSIIEKFRGGPVGLTTLAAAVAEDVNTIENVIEPYLLQIGFLDKTPRGRTATQLAHKHLNKKFTP